LLCCFFARQRQHILNAGIVIPEELFAYGAILEPIYMLMCQFESRRSRFDMREKKLANSMAVWIIWRRNSLIENISVVYVDFSEQLFSCDSRTKTTISH
jgi:hypothetical protein